MTTTPPESPPPVSTPPPTTSIPGTEVHRHGDHDTTPVVQVTQARLQALLARESDQGARTLVRGRYQVDTLEAADDLVAVGRAALAAGWKKENGQIVPAPAAPPPAGAGAPPPAVVDVAEQVRVALAAALDAERAQQATREAHERVLTASMAEAGCSAPDQVRTLLAGVAPVGTDPLRVQAEVARLRATVPGLFAGAAHPAAYGPGAQGAAVHAPTVPGALPADAGLGQAMPPSTTWAAVPTTPVAPGYGPVPVPPLGSPPAAQGPPQGGGFGAAGRAEAAARFAKPSSS